MRLSKSREFPVLVGYSLFVRLARLAHSGRRAESTADLDAKGALTA